MLQDLQMWHSNNRGGLLLLLQRGPLFSRGLEELQGHPGEPELLNVSILSAAAAAVAAAAIGIDASICAVAVDGMTPMGPSVATARSVRERRVWVRGHKRRKREIRCLLCTSGAFCWFYCGPLRASNCREQEKTRAAGRRLLVPTTAATGGPQGAPRGLL